MSAGLGPSFSVAFTYLQVCGKLKKNYLNQSLDCKEGMENI